MKCPECDTEHELLEPAFRRPEEVFRLSREDRASRVDEDDNMCRMLVLPDSEIPATYRYFLRTVLPVRIRDRDDFTHWGIWVETSEADMYRVRELWSDPRQALEPPFPGKIANGIPGYPSTLNLPVLVHLTDPSTRAAVYFPVHLEHPFAEECRAGVTVSRVLEWLRSMGIGC